MFLVLGYIAAVLSCLALYSLYRGCLLKCTQHRQQGSTCCDQSSMLLHNHVSRHDSRRPSRWSSTTKSPELGRRPQPGRRSSVEAEIPRLGLLSDDMVRIESLTRLMAHFDKLDQGFSAATQPARRLHRSSSENDVPATVNSSNSALQTHCRVKSRSKSMQNVQALLLATASKSQTRANTKRSPRSDHAKAGKNSYFDLRGIVDRSLDQNTSFLNPISVSVSSSSRFYAEVVKRATIRAQRESLRRCV